MHYEAITQKILGKFSNELVHGAEGGDGVVPRYEWRVSVKHFKAAVAMIMMIHRKMNFLTFLRMHIRPK